MEHVRTEPEAVIAPIAHTVLPTDDHALRLYNGTLQPLADGLGRNIQPYVQHGGDVTPSDLRRQISRDNEPYALHFFQVPSLHEIGEMPVRRVSIHFGTQFDNSGQEVMLDAMLYADTPEEDLETALELYGLEAGSDFLGAFDLAWIRDHFPPRRRTTERHAPPKGYVFRDAAFVPYDLVHYTGADEYIERLIEQIVEVYTNAGPRGDEGMSEEERVAWLEERRKAREEAARARMIENVRAWAQHASESGVRTALAEAEDAQTRAEMHRRTFVQSVHQAEHARQRVEVMRAAARSPDTKAIEALQRMLDNGSLTSVTATPGERVLTFETRTLYAEDERSGAYHEIGRMRITINLESSALTIMNLDRQVAGYNSGMQAPHVFANGSPCMGSFSEMVADLVAEQNWIDFITSAIAFVESANTADAAGKYVHNWPFVEEPESVGLPPYERDVRPFSFDEPDDDDYEDEEE